VPLPAPLVPPVIDSQLPELVAVQAQPLPAVRLALPVVAPAAALNVVGENA
jgi:hypothetical protein